MKQRLLALTAVLCLLLASCSSMLNRSYSSVADHVDKPTTAEDSSALRVENYRELVSAVLYLVNQGVEEGTIRLYDYPDDVSADLARACAEVATQDPLGAYAVDYIRHEYIKVVSYYEAALAIGYRRTVEQMRSIVNVTGTGAIRSQLQTALREFDAEVVLRVGYFSQNADSIRELIQETYREDPITAVGHPRAEINLYPETGRDRVVEVLLTWPESADAIQAKRDRLRQLADEAGATPELVELLYRLDDETEEPRSLICLTPDEGDESLYYIPLGEDRVYTLPELEELGYYLPLPEPEETPETGETAESPDEAEALQTENP